MNTNTGATWIKRLAGVLGVAGASVLIQFPAAAESVMPDSASESMPTAEVADTAAEPTIVEIAAGNESFSTLTAALEAAGLLETLSGAGPFTVFAPTNEAFAALPEGTLEEWLKPENQEALIEILTYHVVPGKVMSADLADGEVTTVQGSPVTIDLSNGVMVGNANVVTADIPASNGVIHVIDTVMIPESMMAPAAAEEMQEMELPTLEPTMDEEMPMEMPEEMPSGSMEMPEEIPADSVR
ncbi:MAG TPA: fasciclin domain-containing protein [Oscillatoriales cyanobacterium M59_W2019_021]|nr:MAG: fasciclin domain-containing protein [Cyanobacteria bacterium J055]HIK32661.1 fasciclin domain-containing protein [Oscillatoriales cyanobacterium M4454_W2019_049]HIK52409.1 fasciclin domain-containing protein [Oscillatoriales cyanobacterium M59_W2019_021]